LIAISRVASNALQTEEDADSAASASGILLTIPTKARSPAQTPSSGIAGAGMCAITEDTRGPLVFRFF